MGAKEAGRLKADHKFDMLVIVGYVMYTERNAHPGILLVIIQK